MLTQVSPQDLSKLKGLVRIVSEKNPEMPIQTLRTVLEIASAGPDGIMQNELPAKINLAKSATFRNLRSLGRIKNHKDGTPGLDFVATEILSQDNRKRRVWLTEKGWRFVNALLEAIR